MEFLQINNLNKSFGGLHAVNDISFMVQKNIIKAIIGPNGAGKTTLFNLISGNIKSDAGDIVFNGDRIHALLPYQIAEKGLSRTFQNIKLFSHMTVLENVMIGRHLKSQAGFFSGLLNLPWTWTEEKIIKQQALELLNFLDIAKYAHHRASDLPFGTQRLVEFARALATEPILLLLDEPASGLNQHETEEMAKIILRIKQQGITIILIEHDMSLVMNISDSIVVLNSGKKITEGVPHEIQSNKEVIEIYLGEDNA